MQFVHPEYLLMLIAIPVIALLYAWARYNRKNKLRRLGPRLSSALMLDVSRYTGWIKMSLELLAMAVLIVCVARPYMPVEVGEATEKSTAKGIEVMICMDVSNSMLASSTDDPAGVSRLQRAKFILEKLVNNMDNDKVGLIVFAGEAYTQLPITSDYISAKMFINDITTDMVPTQGTAIGTAIDMAVNSFTPDSKFEKAIVLITDGENFEDDATGEAARAREAGIQVDVVGLGTPGGAPIPVGKNEYMTDYNGQRVVTRLNEQMAQEIARAGGGVYVNGASSGAIGELTDKLDTLAKNEYERSASSPASELFPLFAVIALLLLMIDTLIPYRKISWLKRINFFTKNN